MPDSILNNLIDYWFILGGAALCTSGIFYVVDKFSSSEKNFLSDCLLVKNENLAKKSLILKDFIEKIKNNFDDAQEIEENTYRLFFSNLSRHQQYDIVVDNIRKKFKLYRNLLLALIVGVFLSLFIGYIFLEVRIYLSIFNILMMLFALILIFLIRHLGSKLDDLLNHPDLFSSI